ncbi:TAM domain methyltransferase [Colletotrichum salicis]|uniref:TAM domain methyltransferase n=1 Tax=Colletotrichum salicis TaxID=1209931 RepID=A0A135RVG8_9PEZI|nr:TAM domain methyltransferase [Colletotrichum salicis]
MQDELWAISLDFASGMAPPGQLGAEVGRVLDVGTGSGIWAINYADDHPDVETTRFPNGANCYTRQRSTSDAPTLIPEGLPEKVQAAGFVDVAITAFKWPLNDWAKDPKTFEWTAEEVNVFLVDVRKDVNNRIVHGYLPTYSIIGRKPEKGQTSAVLASQAPVSTKTPAATEPTGSTPSQAQAPTLS